MNKTITAVLAFVAGAAIGAGATCKFFKTKYEAIANEEIASVKEVYSRKAKDEATDTGDNSEETEEPAEQHTSPYPIMVTVPRATKHDDKELEAYSNLTNKYMKKGEPAMKDRPYVISPDDFGERDDYETVSLTYYADGILAHDDDTVIKTEDIDEMVGADFAEHFGEYEDDSVFVRNSEMEIDFEILLDNRKFSDVVGM